MNKTILVFSLFFLSVHSWVVAQEEEDVQTTRSNIQNYTPSKLLEIGKWDVKWFNNLYTETESTFGGVKSNKPRENYFNTSLEVFTGVTSSKWLNIGFVVEYRSNTFAGNSATSVFGFTNKAGEARSGLGHIAPSIKVAPFKSLSNFSLQSSFFVPTHDQESDANGFLTEKSYIWQNRLFYDYTLPGDKFQLFTEIGARWFMGEQNTLPNGSSNPAGGYANNSIDIAPGVFFSYFPTSKFTVLVFSQHAHLKSISNNYERNFTTAGAGAKYQVTNALNIEVLYSKFVRGQDTGLGQSFNLGARLIL